MSTLKVDRNGEDAVGISVYRKGDTARLLMTSGHKLVRKKVMFHPQNHHYKEQAAVVMGKLKRQFERELGQTGGDKFKTKKKKVQIYTLEQVREFAKAAKKKDDAKRTSIRSTAGGRMADGNDDRDSEDDSDEQDFVFLYRCRLGRCHV